MFGQVCLVIIVLLFTIGSGSIIMSLLLDTYHNDHQPPVLSPVRNVVEDVFITDDSGIMEVEYNKKPISDILETFEFDDIEI